MCVKLTRIAVAIVAFTVMYGCSSATWEDAQRANTYEAYQAYIEDNPNGEYIEQANMRSDSLYWATIQNDSTAQRFESYLNKFPDGQFKSEAQIKLNQISSSSLATEGRVTGSNIIIRSDHTTESPSAGVVAKEGTVVQLLDQYSSGSSDEAILKRNLTIVNNGNQLKLPGGKAVRVLADRNDSVQVSFATPNYGAVEATISKNDIEAMSGQKWYKIHTNDDITGWIYGKFIEEM